MNYNLINFCENDKYAVKSYCAVHNVSESLNLGDITQVDIESLPTNIDFITHGSPCQSFSIAGNQHGGIKGSGTRSSLLWNSVEIIKHCRPKFVIWENVKNVLNKKHRPVFNDYMTEMKKNGYNTYYKVLNALDYNIPQSRERLYAVSIREDIDNNTDYKLNYRDNMYYRNNLFPEPLEFTKPLYVLLEQNVSDNYFLSDTLLKGFIRAKKRNAAKGNGFGFNGTIDINKYSHTVTTREGRRQNDNFISQAQLNKIGYIKKNREGERIYDNKLPCCRKASGGQGLYLVKEGKEDALSSVEYGDVRRLTPKECWRLMGFTDEDFNKASNAYINKRKMSDTQLLKQAGNSIVVNVLEEIYKCLKTLYPDDFKTDMNVISLFSGIGAFEKALEKI